MFGFLLHVLINIIIALILIIIPVVTILYKTSFGYWKKRNVYTWKPTFPFGNAKNAILQKQPFGFDLVELYNDVKSKSLRYGGYYLCFTPVFIPVDVDLIKKMCINDFEHFSDRLAHVDNENDPISANLVYLSRERWNIIRSVIRPFVSRKNITLTLSHLKYCADNLLMLVENTMATKDSVDVKEVLDRYAIDAIGQFFFNFNCNTMGNSNSTFKDRVTNFFNTSITDSFIRLIFLLPVVVKYAKLKSCSIEVTRFFSQLVEDLFKSRQQISNDLLFSLSTNAVPITKNEIIGNVAVLFLAGYETTSNSTSFCLYELASNKSLQDAVRLEIKTILKKHNDEFSYNLLEELVLLEKCIKETLRKHSPVVYVSRICTKKYCVPYSDLIIDKGTHVYIPVKALHSDPEFYPNPEVFNPERFSKENTLNRPTCAWIPFGTGPRHCIGYKFSDVVMKLALISLLQNYECYLHSSTTNTLEYDPNSYILQSKKAIRLRFKKI